MQRDAQRLSPAEQLASLREFARILGGTPDSRPKPRPNDDWVLLDAAADRAAMREQDRLDEMASADRRHDRMREGWAA